MPAATSFIARSVRFSTNNATPQTALTYGTKPGHVYHFKVIIVATDGTTSASYERIGTFEHSSAGTVTQISTTTSVHTAEDISTPMDVALAADDTNKQITVTVTGDPGRNLNWIIYPDVYFSRV